MARLDALKRRASDDQWVRAALSETELVAACIDHFLAATPLPSAATEAREVAEELRGLAARLER